MTAPAIRPGPVRFAAWLFSVPSWGVGVFVAAPGDCELVNVTIDVDM